MFVGFEVRALLGTGLVEPPSRVAKSDCPHLGSLTNHLASGAPRPRSVSGRYAKLIVRIREYAPRRITSATGRSAQTPHTHPPKIIARDESPTVGCKTDATYPSGAQHEGGGRSLSREIPNPDAP